MAIGAVLSLIFIIDGMSGEPSVDKTVSLVDNQVAEKSIETSVDTSLDSSADTSSQSNEIKSVTANLTKTNDTNNDDVNRSSVSNKTATEVADSEEKSNDTVSESIEPFEGYTLIEVDGGDLSGFRQASVVVDIGFGDRKYYAFTNEYGQLVKVIANEIILQDDSIEPVTSEGRYYPDEAKVPGRGTELENYDEGHVIADSLGGVANAYNITPQDSTLNRHGD